MDTESIMAMFGSKTPTQGELNAENGSAATLKASEQEHQEVAELVRASSRPIASCISMLLSLIASMLILSLITITIMDSIHCLLWCMWALIDVLLSSML
jgi:hypothetical protein